MNYEMKICPYCTEEIKIVDYLFQIVNFLNNAKLITAKIKDVPPRSLIASSIIV